MNLSEKVEETFEKIKPHHDAPPLATEQSGALQNNTAPKMSFNMSDLKDYLLIIISVAVTLATIFLVIVPQYGEISLISTNFTSVQTKLSEVTRQSDYLKGLVGLKDELENKIEVSNQALPNAEDRVPYTLDQIIQIAEKSNVAVVTLSLSGISDTEEGSTNEVREVLIQASFFGDHEDIQQFFYNLEKARTIIDVVAIQLALEEVSTTSTDEIGDTITSVDSGETVSLSLKAYIKADSETEGVDLQVLANSPNYDAVIEKLNGMDFYETSPVDIEFGRDNPFGTEESTPSFIINDGPEEDIIDEEDDASGFE